MKSKILVLLAFVVCTPGISTQAQTWDFTSAAQGWQIIDRFGSRADGYTNASDVTYAPDWSATGGNPGGFISHVDPSTAPFIFVSPQNLGDYSGFLGGTLNFSLNCDSPSNWANDNYVILRSSAGTLFSQITLPVQSTWNNYSISLDAAHFVDLAGNSITTGTLNNVLLSLGTVEISAEYTASPPWEITALDSVSFQAVPEPATAPLALAGLAALGYWLRRHRK